MQSSDDKLVLYGDYQSQPSRAIFAFCLLNNIPHEVRLVSVTGLEQYSKDFKKVNPNAKVPAITDGSFNLSESHTILRYLCRSRSHMVADHWYPAKDLQ